MTVPSTTHNLNGFLKNVVSRTKGAKSALSTLIISRLWNFSIELKPPSFIFVLAHKGTFLSSLPTISIALNQVHLKVIKRQFSRMSMFYQGLQTVHIVFFSEVFFFKWPDYQILLWIFFYYRIHYELLNRKRGKKQQLVTGGSKRLLTPWAFFPSTLMMFLTVFITLIINAWYVCCKYKTMFHFYIERTCVPSSSFGGRCIRCTNSSTCRAFSILVKVFLN